MKIATLSHCFARMGARVKFGLGGLNVIRDEAGEFFRLDLELARADGYAVVDVRPRERHLVLLGRAERFLCGHDERAWFVAAVPGRRSCKVVDALDALQPTEVRASLLEHGVSRRHRHRRRNAGFVRQGEWFFLPRPDFVPRPELIRRDHPLVRPGSRKSHVADFYCSSSPERTWSGDTQIVRGRVRHPDHATVVLAGWHLVRMSAERSSQALAYLD